MSTGNMLNALQAYLAGFDLSDKSSAVASVISVNTAFIAVTTLTMALRLYVRCWIVRAVGLDDILMALAAVLAITLSSFCLRGAHYGLGEHIWNLSPEPFVFLTKAKGITQSLYVSYLSYAAAITFTKCSIIASCLRVFPNPRFRKLLKATGITVIAIWLCSLFVIIFQCTPVSAAWDWTVMNGRCINIVDYFLVTSTVGIVTDIVLCVAPIPLIIKMKMSRSQRMIVCMLFGFGAFACVASMLRLSQLHHLRSIDLTYSSVGSINWSVAEVGTAIVCASVPSLRPLISTFLPRQGSVSSPVTADVRIQNGKSASFTHDPSTFETNDVTDGKWEWHQLSSGSSISSPAAAYILPQSDRP